ncbi:MAG: hypothetical protein Q9182_007016 [Xanthomendoza sp. 2 TL-2023]
MVTAIANDKDRGQSRGHGWLKTKLHTLNCDFVLEPPNVALRPQGLFTRMGQAMAFARAVEDMRSVASEIEIPRGA